MLDVLILVAVLALVARNFFKDKSDGRDMLGRAKDESLKTDPV